MNNEGSEINKHYFFAYVGCLLLSGFNSGSSLY